MNVPVSFFLRNPFSLEVSLPFLSKTHPSSLTLKGGSTLTPKPPFPPGKGDVAGSRYSSRQFFLYRQQAFARKGLPIPANATGLRFFVAQAFRLLYFVIFFFVVGFYVFMIVPLSMMRGMLSMEEECFPFRRKYSIIDNVASKKLRAPHCQMFSFLRSFLLRAWICLP